MAEPLSTDLRKRVVDAVNGGMSRRQAAAHFKVGASSAIRWVAQSLATGDVTPKRQGGDRRSMAIEAQAAFILSLLGPQGDATLAEMRGVLLAAGHSFSISALSRFFARRGVTLKKVCARDRARSARYPEAPSGLVRSQLDLDPEKLVFIDETWASTNMARRCGRAPKGERLRAAIPHGH